MEALVLNRSAICEPLYECHVCVNPTITGHAWLARNTSWDKDDVTASQALPESRWRWVVAGNLGTS
jgi:hypothetical protein